MLESRPVGGFSEPDRLWFTGGMGPLVMMAGDDRARVGAGWWRTALAMGPAAAAFCERLRAWAGRSWDGRPWPRHDYVHTDLNLGNVLVTGDRLAGVTDIEHFGVSDRGIDVARLAARICKIARAGAAIRRDTVMGTYSLTGISAASFVGARRGCAS